MRLTQQRGTIALLAATAVALGAVVRVVPVLGASFPPGLGGMFVTILDQLHGAALPPPTVLAYNDAHIPFAYPPLGLYVAAAGGALGATPIDALSVLPAIYCVLTIPAFFLVARSLVGSRRALVATYAYALLPAAWEPLIEGAGIARGLGMVLALLAIHQAVRFAREPKIAPMTAAAVLAGLALLSHPGTGAFAALSIVVVLFFASADRPFARLFNIAAVIGGGVLLAAPWLVWVLAHDGVGPLVGAINGQGGWQALVFNALTLRWLEAPFGELTIALGLVGLIGTLGGRRFFLPAWLLVSFVGNGRAVAIYAAVPFALLIAYGIVDVMMERVLAPERTSEPSQLRSTSVRILLAAALSMAIISNLFAPSATATSIGAVSAAERQAMAWSHAHLPTDSRVAVVTGGSWADDYISEWFPALAGMRSVATAQGYEWLGPKAFGGQQERDNALQQCASAGSDCLRDWIAMLAKAGERVTDIYVAKDGFNGCCMAFADLMSSSGAFVRIYNGPGAAIFAVPSG